MNPFFGLRAVIFDFDGTLAETNINFAEMRRRIYELVQAWGLWEEGMGDDRYVLEVIEAARAKLDEAARAKAFGREAEQVLVDVEMETVGNAAPYAGVPEALQTLLDHDYRIGIVTRNARACVDHFLSRHPLPHEVCLTREEVELVKPHPYHLLAALERLDIAPQAAVMVGDHRSDIECAIAAGARSVGVHLTGTDAQQFAELGADASYPDVPAFVQDLCLG
ncbi:MAG: HAD family hydrolase [Armatimonadota bacterium]